MGNRSRNNRLDTIEYIGPRPQKPQAKRPNFIGGWVVLLIASGAVFMFSKSFLAPIMGQDTPTTERASELIKELSPSARPGDRLAGFALQQTQFDGIQYEDAYYDIGFPNGDIPSTKGKAEDLVVRSYRAIGVDLQQRVHEDMKGHFSEYPQIFGRRSADSNIDHRLTENLRRFFRRSGAELLVTNGAGEEVPSRNAEDYIPGDIVTWRLPSGGSHIGIIVPGPGEYREQAWVVHHMRGGNGPAWENCLLDFNITGHYRYDGSKGIDLSAHFPLD